jgi:hypothetical protein
VAAVLAGARGQPPAVLGDVLDALDINPLICGPSGVAAADVLVVVR